MAAATTHLYIREDDFPERQDFLLFQQNDRTHLPESELVFYQFSIYKNQFKD